MHEIIHELIHAVTHSLEDVLKSVPILFIVYAILYFMEHKMRSAPNLIEKTQRVGPVIGALAGSIPQCGFSAAASALFAEGFLAPATLVAVFLATSDEAVPLLISGGASHDAIALLIIKIIIAIIGGYFLHFTFLKPKNKNTTPVNMDISHHGHNCCGSSPFSAIILRTLKTCAFLLLIMVIIHIAVEYAGEDRIAALMLGGSIFQPIICAFIGLIPSCAISVLFSQLYMSGVISFGSMIAGLSTGAGFGYMILLREKSSRKRALPVILATWFVAAISGIICQVLIK